MAHVLDVAYARSHFPALKSGYIFADNAGGSQITQSSIDLIVRTILSFFLSVFIFFR